MASLRAHSPYHPSQPARNTISSASPYLDLRARPRPDPILSPGKLAKETAITTYKTANYVEKEYEVSKKVKTTGLEAVRGLTNELKKRLKEEE